MKPLRIVVVDDEKPARMNLRAMLRSIPFAEWVGEYAGGDAALHGMKQLSPDVVLLDVEMAGKSGLEVARRMATVQPDATVVFVTAHTDYAVEAFDVKASNYLLKPVDQLKLVESLDRVRRERATTIPSRSVAIEITVRNRKHFMDASDIKWIEGAGNYVRLHVGEQVVSHRATLDSLESELTDRFVRIHRSIVVNADHVSEVQSSSGGATVTLHDGTRLRASRRRSKAVHRLREVRKNGT